MNIISVQVKHLSGDAEDQGPAQGEQPRARTRERGSETSGDHQRDRVRRRTRGFYGDRPRTPALACLGASLISFASLSFLLSVEAGADVAQKGNVRVAFSGRMTPQSLPRSGAVPVRVAVGARISAVDGTTPPALRRIRIEINRHGRLQSAGLPSCNFDQIQPSTTAGARRACGDALVGRGAFSSNVLLPEISPFPSEGSLDAFNGTYRGRPAILAHIYGTDPVPTSYTIPFTISRSSGTYGVTLSAPMPATGSGWGYITALSLNLGRSYTIGGERRSYLAAACPLPAGIDTASYRFARATFDFGAETVSSVLSRHCHAR